MKYLKWFLSVILALGLVTPAYASDEVLSSAYIAENDPNVHQIVINSQKLFPKEVLSYNPKTGVVSFNYANYSKIDDKREFMIDLLSSVNSSGLGDQRKNKLYNFVSSQDASLSEAVRNLTSDTSADFYTAYTWLKPFTGGFSTFLGFVVLFLFSAMAISIIIDMAALTLPPLRVFAQDKYPYIISTDARNAIKSEASTGRPAIFYWLRSRLVVLVIASVMILWLVTGSIYDMTAWLLYAMGAR